MKEYVWLCLFLPICTTDSSETNPCESRQVAANVTLIMNGSFSDKTTAIKTCQCVITTTRLVVLNFQFFTVPVENCGSELRVTKTNGSAISMVCQSSGSIEVGGNELQVNVSLTKQPSPQNTTFSIQITSGYENANIQATCSTASSDEITTSIFTTHVTQNTKDNASTITQLKNMETSTLTTENIQSSSTSPFSSTSPTNPNLESFVTGDNNIIYYAIGGGGGGVVVVILIIVTVVLCRRCSSRKSQENENTDDNEVDELQYNVLYVSSANCDNDTNTRNREKQSYIPHDEGNYSSVDIEKMSETSNMNHLNEHYSLPYNHNKGEPATTLKTKSLTKSSDNVNRAKTHIEHVIPPGGEGYEYAIVNKHGENIKPSDNAETPLAVGLNENTYAVVDKIRNKNNMQ